MLQSQLERVKEAGISSDLKKLEINYDNIRSSKRTKKKVGFIRMRYYF